MNNNEIKHNYSIILKYYSKVQSHQNVYNFIY